MFSVGCSLFVHAGPRTSTDYTVPADTADALSLFSFSVKPDPDVAGQTQIVFDPIVVGRSYTVMTSPHLGAGSWNPLSGGTTSNDGDERTVTDPAPGETATFYKVKIEKP